MLFLISRAQAIDNVILMQSIGHVGSTNYANLLLICVKIGSNKTNMAGINLMKIGSKKIKQIQQGRSKHVLTSGPKKSTQYGGKLVPKKSKKYGGKIGSKKINQIWREVGSKKINQIGREISSKHVLAYFG